MEFIATTRDYSLLDPLDPERLLKCAEVWVKELDRRQIALEDYQGLFAWTVGARIRHYQKGATYVPPISLEFVLAQKL